MSKILDGILEIKKSKPYIDYYNYHKDNILGITKMSRQELMHSNFIAWALSPTSSHALQLYPVCQFARSLNKIEKNADNLKARKLTDIDPLLPFRFAGDDFIVDAWVRREVPVEHTSGTKTTNKYIDLIVEIKTKDKILPIIIENKVNSKENGDKGGQTLVYFNWAEKEYANTAKYYQPLYVYLYPKYNNKLQKSPDYIRMTYQELVDNVLEPSMHLCGNAISVKNYREYLQCLSFQTDNEKGGKTMCISGEEKKILEAFADEHIDLLTALLTELEDIPDSAKAAISKSLAGRRHKYIIQGYPGGPYLQGPTLLAVIKQYAEDHPTATFGEFAAAFSMKLASGKPVVRNIDDLTAKEIEDKRAFLDSPITTDDGKTLVVNNQVQHQDMAPFIKLAADAGYIVEEV